MHACLSAAGVRCVALLCVCRLGLGGEGGGGGSLNSHHLPRTTCPCAGGYSFVDRKEGGLDRKGQAVYDACIVRIARTHAHAHVEGSAWHVVRACRMNGYTRVASVA